MSLLESILNTGKSLTGMLVGDVCVRSVLVWGSYPSVFLSLSLSLTL